MVNEACRQFRGAAIAIATTGIPMPCMSTACGGHDVHLHDLDHFKTQEVAISSMSSAARTFESQAQLACGIDQTDVD
jgi:hypothetical protein